MITYRWIVHQKIKRIFFELPENCLAFIMSTFYIKQFFLNVSQKILVFDIFFIVNKISHKTFFIPSV